MSILAPDITIAVTVFNRRQFLKQAIGSALAQTAPVRVMVVEDCGPDPGLEDFVRREFGSRIEYFRNPRRRGLFGNWNACMEYCRTPWLSLLHDDDFLAPGFVEAMLRLSRAAPGAGLYFGRTEIVDPAGAPIEYYQRPPQPGPWQRVELADAVEVTPFPFPGQIFRVEYARTLGGFRETSQYCGDWEMWCNLIARHGAFQANEIVAYNRQHTGAERGTMKIVRNGRMRPLSYVQQKRIFHLLRQSGVDARFNRSEWLKKSPMAASYLVKHGAGLSPRVLRYHVELLLRSTPPSLPYAVFQTAARWLGVPFVRTASRLYRLVARPPR